MSESDGRRTLRVLVQLVGFLVGIALLAWCASVALSEENRSQLERLREASVGDAAGLIGLTAAIIVVNGLVFWLMLRPVRKLGAVGVVATSSIATFLALLPFKLSIASRVLIHHRRDGVALLTIGAWFGAMGVAFVGTIGVVAAAAFVRARWELSWTMTAAIGAAGLVAFGGATLAGARLFRGPGGLARLERWTGALAVGPTRAPATRLVRSEAFARLHGGFDMLGSFSALGGSIVLRLIDLGLQVGRFMLAGGVAGVAMDLESAVLLACAHASIGMVSPFGTLGAREAGTLGLAAAFGLVGADTSDGLAVVLLVVGAIDAATSLVLAGLGVAWLRPDRLLRRRWTDGA